MSKPLFPDMPDIDELLQRLLDDQIQPDEMERLQKAIREDARVRDYYIDSMLVCAVIRRSSQVTGELSESDLIQALSSNGHKSGAKRVVRHLYSIAAILLLGFLVLGYLSLIHHKNQGPAIGTLVDTYEAQWQGYHPQSGEPLYAVPYDLRQGAAKMELNEGTSLLLEAPCRVELTGIGEVALKSGRLTVSVPSQAKGFRVRTPTALITDLGTEFGVIAHSDGSTEAHVFKGRINIALDPDRTGQPTSLIVNEGQATTVDATGGTIQGGLAARADLFILKLLQLPSLGQPAGPSEQINLADMVGGGNGHGTGKLEDGIDLGNGQTFNGPTTVIWQAYKNEFHSTPQFRGIDGVFVPNGAYGPAVISSTGLTFSECPQTLGSYFGGPANSGKFFNVLNRQIYTARLNGTIFGKSRHPALSLHPNAGITFDLDQIRQDNPNIQIDRFTAVCGIPKDLPHTRFSSADVWILLDGVVHLHLQLSMDKYVVEKVDVPITAQTRFLTLVTTCSGRADFSWIIFGDPFLGPAAEVREEAAP
jgi:hypothetical protein